MTPTMGWLSDLRAMAHQMRAGPGVMRELVAIDRAGGLGAERAILDQAVSDDPARRMIASAYWRDRDRRPRRPLEPLVDERSRWRWAGRGRPGAFRLRPNCSSLSSTAHGRAVSLLDVYARGLEDPDRDVRLFCLDGLIFVSDPGRSAVIERGLRDRDAAVRRRACQSAAAVRRRSR